MCGRAKPRADKNRGPCARETPKNNRMNEDIDNFLTGQLAHWPTAQHNYAALSRVRVKTLDVDGTAFRVQCNPARIISSAARVDERSIRQRACFLCAANRPAEQEAIRALEGRYDILVNPFPIFPRHLTLAATDHVPQRIAPRLADLLRLARMLPGYTLFYNGPRCGASAPDHAHFQAGSRGFLPIETQWTSLPAERLGGCGHSSLYGLNGDLRRPLVIDTADEAEAAALFHTVCQALPVPPGHAEPMLNLLCWYDTPRWVLVLFPRRRHRPSCYDAPGDGRLLCSPASVDMGGVFILPMEKDFERINAADLRQILSEVCPSAADFDELKQQIRSAWAASTSNPLLKEKP